MWVLKWIMWVVLILILIYFGAANSFQTVRVNFISWHSPDLQLWVVMYMSFSVGVLVWLGASIVKVWQLKGEIRKLNKENTTLKNEFDNLRKFSIEDEISGISET